MIAGVSGQVLTDGDLDPEDCVVKIASLLRLVAPAGDKMVVQIGGRLL